MWTLATLDAQIARVQDAMARLLERGQSVSIGNRSYSYSQIGELRAELDELERVRRRLEAAAAGKSGDGIMEATF